MGSSQKQGCANSGKRKKREEQDGIEGLTSVPMPKEGYGKQA
jgi:hypothetical protein